MRKFTQLMMRKAEIVCATDEIHPRLKRSEATCSMARFARQAGEPFSKGPIQALDESRVEDCPSARTLQQPPGLRLQTMSHAPGDLDDPFLFCSLDHSTNVQLRPDLQAGSSHSCGSLHFFSERSADTPRIGAPAVCQHE